MKQWFKSGSPWIWLNAAAVSTCLILVIGLLGLVTAKGLVHFWPAQITAISYQENGTEPETVLGEITDISHTSAIIAKAAGYNIANSPNELVQYLLKIGNRDLYGRDFRWLLKDGIKHQAYPNDAVTIERREWGNFYGYLLAVKEDGKAIATGEQTWTVAQKQIEQATAIFEEISRLEKKDIGAINYSLERLRLKQKRLEMDKEWNADEEKKFALEKANLAAEYEHYQIRLRELYQNIRRDSLLVKTADGTELDIPLAKVVRIYQPNAMGLFSKIGFYGTKIVEFLSQDPREANTEGGVFPAIYGTIMMVIIMSIIVTPFGVVAAVYLREYAKQSIITRLIRIAVNNLAGVPSVVYGVFGLGFFVYILGGNVDKLFYPEAAPAPVFGTPGLLWASITLALLTLPVVIVSTEEGLARIPKSIREGSLALGATKLETLWRTVLPMASPAMMTGLILAVARAAGEVAPLMLVGVVKLAPSLPLDGNYPFLHLDRKFMHLGFHIYDVGFQSPNVEAARPLVYATSLLLVIVIVGLNLAAVHIRNHLREKYRALEG
ncbi:MAG: phosphate ABC transporter, permease protein PstA [Methylomonas sp.]|nr:MAG: phosphate ABC transporter, permease protein PstA [Methylobacter sp.]PPD36444.1 MAG: phosphate ABC transporter, permease protein PstA [Methylomonas sp.]